MKEQIIDSPPATWTGAAKVDMSKEGWKDRIQEYATAEFLERLMEWMRIWQRLWHRPRMRR
jgi:hypothetical protein